MEWRAGDVAGMLPYSRLVTPPGDSVAQEPSEILSVPREDLEAMTRECHAITSMLVHKMLDRSRIFTSSSLHDEKMISLGKLSAGLAHELNNPAAAIERSASLLEERLEEAEQATRALATSGLSAAQLAAGDAAARLLPRRRACKACSRRFNRPSARTPSPTGSPITASTPLSLGRLPKRL